MTEADWFAATDPEPMLHALRGRAGERQLRLFAVACCRRMFAAVPPDPRAARAVDVAERYADGAATAAELDAASPLFSSRRDAAAVEAAVVMADSASCNASWGAAAGAFDPLDDATRPAFDARLAAEKRAQAALLRDAVGDPFRPVTLDPAWLTPTAVAVARHVYDARAFHDLPVLADALQDAGCDDAAVLDHCRGPGPHARGCWVVDAVLGRR